ncbi:fatty acid-binding protein 1-like [Mytilus galloprovincialis]|uniref:fatty acid-binding protein 1-like n=1 Tax=Mytilus galloprovincialis TaxID=29158 RepID=UPI003F7C710E
MAQFIGKWQAGKGSMSNFEAFGKAMGLPAEILEKFGDATWTATFTKDGDTWSVEYGSDVSPKRTYSYQEGKELVTTNMFGKGLKLTATFESDTKMTVMEQTEGENGWKSLKAIREIKGDKMIATVQELESGVTMTQEFTRC